MNMASRFKESLGFIKSLVVEDPFCSKNEDEFLNKFIEAPENIEIMLCDELLTNRKQFSERYPYVPNPLYSGFYSNIYDSFKFMYEIETILDEIDCCNISFELSKSLMDTCCFLNNVSTNMMISLDDDFSYTKKYSLENDIFIMVKNLYNKLLFIHSVASENIPLNSKIAITKYDFIENRLCCQYIRNGLKVVKLFHILALMQISPLYNDGIHQIAKSLIHLLREILYDKRIIKFVVDFDTNGFNPKCHKTTRLKIYFAMSNSDRYCLRLDFPHEGEDSVHINLNEPNHKQSTGLPFNGNYYIEAMQICKDKEMFNELFYYRDELYWFRSNYAKKVKIIGNENMTLKFALEKFQHDRSHIFVSSSDKSNLEAVTDFSEAFAEAFAECDDISIYGYTDSNDEELYKYVLFQDFIFDIVIKINNYFTQQNLHIGDFKYENAYDYTENIEKGVKSELYKYIIDKFPQDAQLKEYTTQDMDLENFLSKCLDHINKFEI